MNICAKVKLTWFGHITIRQESLCKTVLQGTLEEGRRRGRQKKSWMDNFNNCLYFWNTEEQSVVTGFTLHKLADMRRTGVGKPRPLLDQEKLDLFRGPDQMRSCTRRIAQRP
ncbi:hypothetical protein DPMN_057956 [Dreissena polymorpha]|uniref:Uncharacterized protein n=1 Tax=Dreissena polymorpha TaxID=45954 RepID=A0A9D4HCV4_DREPO|nr:hypothetical protein DPMN_057956 [Dreissena polymorpha]